MMSLLLCTLLMADFSSRPESQVVSFDFRDLALKADSSGFRGQWVPLETNGLTGACQSDQITEYFSLYW